MCIKLLYTQSFREGQTWVLRKKAISKLFSPNTQLEKQGAKKQMGGCNCFGKMVGKGFLVGIPEEMLDFEGSWAGEEADKVVKLGCRDTHIWSPDSCQLVGITDTNAISIWNVSTPIFFYILLLPVLLGLFTSTASVCRYTVEWNATAHSVLNSTQGQQAGSLFKFI